MTHVLLCCEWGKEVKAKREKINAHTTTVSKRPKN